MTIGLSVARGLLRQLPGRFGSTVLSTVSKQHYHTTFASKSLLLASPKAITLPFARLFHQSTPGLKEVVFKLTDVGEGIAEVEILRWFVKEGDDIKQFDKLCEVQSDKANVEITSRFDGKITKLHHNKGDMAKVGHPLVTLDDDLDNNDTVQGQQPTPSAAPVHSTKSHSPANGKIIPFKLTDVGEGIAEVEILRWFVKEGDDIKQFDKLCEVQSDKANVEITSRFDGKIRKLHYNKGDMAKVGQPLIDIESDEPASSTGSSSGHSQASSSSSLSSQPSYAQKQDQSSSKFGKTLASPAVRRLAREFKVDIAKLNATGRDGRVTKGDILNFVSNPSAVLAASESVQSYTSPKINVPASEPKSFPSLQTLVSQSYATPSIPQQPQQQPTQVAPSPVANLEKDRVIPVRGLMRTMIKTMSESLQIPALGYSDEIIMNDLIKLRLDLKPAAESKGVKITFMPFLIKAVSMAINQYPIMNSSISKDLSEITIKASHNIGVAMDTPAGLLVPNIKNVQSKSILELAVELNRLQKLGKEGKLSTADLTGGTLTISNIGNIGGTYLRPVILPPEVAIVAFGSIQKLPRYNAKDEVVPHHIMTASWSADHRVIEGATIARFSNVVRDLLENPSKMLLELR